MKFRFPKIIGVLVLGFVFILAACGNRNSADNESIETETASSTVEITDVHGPVSVPVNPERVVALDNRTFQTLEDWGIQLAAAPKGVMTNHLAYFSDETVQDIGNHREPNLEVIAAADPDLVIVGQRFARYYEEIKELVPNATVIDFSFDVSDESDTPGQNLINGLKDATTALGLIFDKTEEANQLIDDLDASIDDVKSAYNGEDTVMGMVVSGGNIGFSAPYHGRVWGPLYEIFDFVPALEVDSSSSDHKGDDISVEAIAQSNPDWILVLDRDAGTPSGSESTPAKDVIENSPALANTTAVLENHITYAPADTYTNESIQTFTKIFADLTDMFSNE